MSAAGRQQVVQGWRVVAAAADKAAFACDLLNARLRHLDRLDRSAASGEVKT